MAAKIERTIAKEPAYQSKTPKYCLLVFGPEAKTRVWLVLDGNVLYVDRKGDGDWTGMDKRVANQSKFPKSVRFRVHNNFVPFLAETKFTLDVYGPEDGAGSIDFRVCDAKGRYPRRRQAPEQEEFRFADRPQDAPILYFDGSLTFQLVDTKQAFVRGETFSRFSMRIGTPGRGKGTFLFFFADDLTATAEIAFPNRNPQGKPIVIQVPMKAEG